MHRSSTNCIKCFENAPAPGGPGEPEKGLGGLEIGPWKPEARQKTSAQDSTPASGEPGEPEKGPTEIAYMW